MKTRRLLSERYPVTYVRKGRTIGRTVFQILVNLATYTVLLEVVMSGRSVRWQEDTAMKQRGIRKQRPVV